MLRRILICGENTKYNNDLESRLQKLMTNWLVTASNEFQKAIETGDKNWLMLVIDSEDLYDEQIVIFPICRDDHDSNYKSEYRKYMLKYANEVLNYKFVKVNSVVNIMTNNIIWKNPFLTRVLVVDTDKDINYVARIIEQHIMNKNELNKAIMHNSFLNMIDLKIVEMVNNEL